MAKRLLLHIGTPKSGTTYLQEWAAANATELLAQGVLWPDLDRYPIVRDLANRPKLDSDTGAWPAFCQQVREFGETVLYSNEVMVTLEERHIQRIVKETEASEIVAVVTARDLGRVVPSQWQTLVRNGGTIGWSDYADAICRLDEHQLEGRRRDRHTDFWKKHDLAGICRRWEAVLGDSSVRVVTVPRESTDSRTLSDRFSLAVGINAAGLAAPTESVNTSLGAHSAELLRLLNEDLKGASRDVRKQAFRDTFAKVIMAQRVSLEPRYGLTSEQLEVIVQRSAEITEGLVGLRVPVFGALQDLVPTGGEPTALSAPEDATAGDLLAAARHGIVGLLELLASSSPEPRSTDASHRR